jgi:2-dehydro-3-deoxyphosphogluconate aldolase/(4S)-4-hydroxy-2-oxoglutarate aldolase
MREIMEKIGMIGIIPVIKIDNAEQAVPLARALASGGIPCAEITFRTSAAQEAIRNISAEIPELLLGAGTVLSVEQAGRAFSAGAQFIVSPGFNPALVAYCLEQGIPVIPGCSCPTDIERALEFGLDTVKFFPAEQAGGLDYIKAVSAPYPNVRFIPTGGINAQNISRYIACDRVLACGGSWMAGSELIKAGDFEKISALSREAVLRMLDFRVTRIGINADTGEAARSAARVLGGIFGFSLADGTPAPSGAAFEILNPAGQGSRGHIAIGTASLARAAAFLRRMGIELDDNAGNGDFKKPLSPVYLKEQILGFAVRLAQTAA